MRHFSVFLMLLTLPFTLVYADLLRLNNGDTLSGKIIEANPQRVIFDHPLLGRLTIPRDKIAAIPDLGDHKTASLAARPKPQATTNQRIEAGLSGASGNSRNSDFRLGYQRRSKSAQRHSLLKTSYQRQSSDGNTEENDFFAELTHDWLMPHNPWFRFAQGRYDWDDFEDWDSRLGVSGGSGYRFVDRTDLRIAGRLGLGLTQTFGGEDDELDPEGIVGFDSNWQINPRQSLEFGNTLYLELEEIGELRNLTSFAWLIRLDQFSGLNLKLGADNEYESRSAGESRSNDLKYDLSLTWELN